MLPDLRIANHDSSVVISAGRANNLKRMDEPIQASETKPHYIWPRYVVAAVLLGVVLAVFAIYKEANRVKQEREYRIPTTEK